MRIDWLTFTAVLIALKLTDEISWPWTWIFAPTAAVIIIVAIGYIKAWIDWHW